MASSCFTPVRPLLSFVVKAKVIKTYAAAVSNRDINTSMHNSAKVIWQTLSH